MNTMSKKTIRDYIYYLETLKDIKEISSIAEANFRTALKESDENSLEALKPKIDINLDEKEEIIRFHDKDFKKLFRKIAVKCHPDKISAISDSVQVEFLKQAYNDLNQANKEYDWGLLLKVAIDLKIDVDELHPEQLENINQKVKELHQEIEKYEKSMAYQWYVKSDGENKQDYLNQCINIFNKFIASETN